MNGDPTGPGHRAVAELERAGRVHAVITQNIDELHQRAGSSPDKLIEVHGTIYQAVCLEAVAGDARLTIVNAQATPYDRYADAVLNDPIREALPRLVEAAVGS